MSDSAIQRLARAIQSAYGDGDEPETHGAAIEAAERVLMALREPGEAMIAAGASISLQVAEGASNLSLSTNGVRRIWQAMIDEAFKET